MKIDIHITMTQFGAVTFDPVGVLVMRLHDIHYRSAATVNNLPDYGGWPPPRMFVNAVSGRFGQLNSSTTVKAIVQESLQPAVRWYGL